MVPVVRDGLIDVGAFPLDASWMRTGHFAMASGHHGRLWLDLELLFAKPAKLQPMIADLGRRLALHEPDAVCGPLSGGGFVAYAIAAAFRWDFLFTERRSASDGSSCYALPAPLVPRVLGRRIAVVDDAINAGSAVRATCATLLAHGAECVALGTLIALGSSPAATAAALRLPLEALLQIPNEIWTPGDCPLCKRGIPLDD